MRTTRYRAISAKRRRRRYNRNEIIALRCRGHFAAATSRNRKANNPPPCIVDIPDRTVADITMSPPAPPGRNKTGYPAVNGP